MLCLAGLTADSGHPTERRDVLRQEIADVLNWDLPEADYRALARLPQNLGEAKEKTTAGVLFEGTKA